MKLNFWDKSDAEAALWGQAGSRDATKAVIFVHGLGSSGGCWTSFVKLCLSDPILDNIAIYKYEYPTYRTWRFWKQPDLDSLAKGLTTEINLILSQYHEVLVVAHSLGGIIVRKAIIDHINEFDKTKIARALLFATPNSGASLASLSSTIFGANKHTQLLKPYSVALTTLNDEWVRIEADAHVSVTLVAGGKDALVAETSVRGIAGRKLDAMLISHDHHSIVRALNHGDNNYRLLREFLRDQTSPLAVENSPENGDPLFEAYRTENEPYFIVRPIDTSLSAAFDGGHVWMSGRSGVGKTAAVIRCALMRSSKTVHIYLGAYSGASGESLFIAAAAEIMDRLGLPSGQVPASLAPAITELSTMIAAAASSEDRLSIVIEELPLPNDELATFCAVLLTLMESIEAREAHNVRFALTSIADPVSLGFPNSAKFRGKTSLLRMDPWENYDIERLATMLNGALRLDRDDGVLLELVRASDGLPRFLKTIFRKLRNSVDGSVDIKTLINQTQREML